MIIKNRAGANRPHSRCDTCRKKIQVVYNRKRVRPKTNPIVVTKDPNYIDNKLLTIELIVSLAAGKLTKRAENMFILMNKNLSKKFMYRNEDDRQDCLSEGLYQVFKNWHNFNPDKSDNAFAYISEIIKRGQAQGFNHINKKVDGDYINAIPLSHLFTDGEINI
jgi:hypothetical protein